MNITNSLLLLADIGNTSIKIGVAHQGQIIRSFNLPTHSLYSADSLGLQLLQILDIVDKKNVCACLLCSVVPDLSEVFQKTCKRYLSIEVFQFPKDFTIPMENAYENPHEVGADRLLAAYAARMLYSDMPGIISVDFGTATTFDCVDHNKYLGGLICPGVFSSHNALAKNTAKLPRISLTLTESVPSIGRNTETSMSHGFVFGFAAMTDGLCEKLKQNLPSPLAIIATGGFAHDIARVSSTIQHVHSDLILEGLLLASGQINA